MPEGETKLTVGEYKIPAELYDYYEYNHTETDGMDAEAAKEASLDDIKRSCGVLSMAKEYGIELIDSRREKVENELAQTVEYVGGEDAFNEYLAQYHMTRGIYVYLAQMAELEDELREYVTDERSGLIRSDDKTVEADIHKNFIAVKQILISNDEGDDIEENEKLFGELIGRVAAEEDFDALIAEYSEDKNSDPVYGRYFTHGMFPEEFEEAAASLLYYNYTAIKTEVGFHIIQRIMIDDEYVDKNFEQLRYLFLNRTFNEMLEKRISELEVEWKDA